MSAAAELAHLVGKARDAKHGGRDAWRVQSTGEKLAVAAVLNHADWIAEMDYTLAEAIDRIGPAWCALLLDAQRQLDDDSGDASTLGP